MIIEEYKRLHVAMEIPSQDSGIFIEKMFDEIVRLERKATRRVNSVTRVGESGSYKNSYKSEGISKMSLTLNLLDSYLPNPVDTPLYPVSIKYGQLGSEALLYIA